MNTLFALLCVLSFIVLCIGIVKPHVIYKWFPENKQSRKSVVMIFGIATMVFFILLDPIIGWLGIGSANHWMHPLSPVSWSSMEYWKLVSSQAPLETGYVFRMYGVLIVFCVIVIAIAARRKQIEVDALQ